MMTINILIICFTVLICVVSGLYVLNKLSKTKFNQKGFELELEKYKFFGSVDTDNIDKEIDKLVKKYFDYYIIYNFHVHDKKYIKDEEIDKAVRDITKNIVVEMSELYIFYFRMLYNINSEDQLTAKVYEKVTDSMIVFAADFNRPKE